MFAHKAAAAAATLILAASAHAAGGTDVGNTSVDDVTLNGQNADAFVFASGWNPHPGDTSGFGTSFDSYGSGAWSILDKMDGGSGFQGNSGFEFTFTHASGSDTQGTWTIRNTGASSVTLDLAFAIHAGNGAGAFLFDNETIGAGATLNGTWKIDWFTGNNQSTPGFSNLTVFGRDVTPVPEPESWGMLLGGLGLLGAAAARRRKQS
ncbi:PEP-CTERM sorting domain-containing protein [Massilia endophytica]|uniref:PEP-CTERM sorting domain-containing protein n=1 Tax=Massilia endophytica TaxID=2899220 RepID=UPI001E573CD1|nr:PEP-CTERM sorting domain-containing protein [Massilia endophytica]UGQ49040.1 PEP-CTERM sorting domain-containing protein [Massilia endophytica]